MQNVRGVSSAKGDEGPQYITHLGLDTSTLIGCGWPHPVLDLGDIVKTCNALEVPVLLPEIVLTEVEAVWQRRTGEFVQKCQDNMRELARRAPDLVDNSKLTWPDESVLASSYTKAVADLLERWNPTITPLPKVSLQEVARLSARQQLPFADADASFRDSLILWSMLEALKEGNRLGILSPDKFFLHARVQAMAKARGCSVVVFKTLEEARTFVETTARLTHLAGALKGDHLRSEEAHPLEALVDRSLADTEMACRVRLGVTRVEIDPKILVLHLGLCHGGPLKQV